MLKPEAVNAHVVAFQRAPLKISFDSLAKCLKGVKGREDELIPEWDMRWNLGESPFTGN